MAHPRLRTPAQTAPQLLDKLRADAAAAIGHPSVADKLGSLGIVLRTSTRPELAGSMQSEVQRWAAVARSVDLKPE